MDSDPDDINIDPTQKTVEYQSEAEPEWQDNPTSLD